MTPRTRLIETGDLGPTPACIDGTSSAVTASREVASRATSDELVEIHGRLSAATDRLTAAGRPGRVVRDATRAMAAVRSFREGQVGFAYTTDVTSPGLAHALHLARTCRVTTRQPPARGSHYVDDGRWLDRSATPSELEATVSPRMSSEAQTTLRSTRTSIFHVRSDCRPVSYTEGGSSVTVRVGPRVDMRWSRHLRASMIAEMLDETASPGQERPWSLRNQPVLFLGSAGAALTAILLRAVLDAPPPVAAVVARRLPAGLALLDDPTSPSGPAAAPFDAEGWPTAPRMLLENAELVIDPSLWGRPPRTRSALGLSRRPDLASPPVVSPANVMLIKQPHAEAAVRAAGPLGEMSRGLVCQGVNIGALSFDPRHATFAAPCSGLLVRGGELTSRRVRGVLQGRVADLVQGIVDVRPRDEFMPLDWGVRAADILVSNGASMLADA